MMSEKLNCENTLSFRHLFYLADAKLHEEDKASLVNLFSDRYLFYRNMGCATVASMLVVLAFSFIGRVALTPTLWIPLYVTSASAFLFRYRTNYSAYVLAVVRGISVLRT